MLDYKSVKINIPFFDAVVQYLAQKEEIDVAIQKVLCKGVFINGLEVTEFSSRLASYLNVNDVVPCGNGTDALYLALLALNLEKGDEVIIPTFNFIAVAEVVALLGLIPVFVDSQDNDFNIDPSKIEGSISPKTKAIVVVHLFGAVADMERINLIAKKHKLFVVEDVAQSLGSEYKGQKAGTIGHIGCTSFFPTKNLACFGDGGAIFTNDKRLAKKIKMLTNHGQINKYEHQLIGVNSRLDTLQAAILNVQMVHLEKNIAKRRAIAKKYTDELGEIDSIKLPYEAINTLHSYNQYCVLLPDKAVRDGVKENLRQNGIGSMVYYPKPNHLQAAYAMYGYTSGDFPIAEKLCNRILALPIFPTLLAQQQDYIIKNIKDFFARYGY